MIKVWHEGMSDAEAKDLAYWERNMLATYYADGWYNDDTSNYPGWRRVLTLSRGRITFHIPDDFDVGDLRQVEPNWDGHTTKQKWQRIMTECGIQKGMKEKINGIEVEIVPDSQGGVRVWLGCFGLIFTKEMLEDFSKMVEFNGPMDLIVKSTMINDIAVESLKIDDRHFTVSDILCAEARFGKLKQ